MAKQMQIREEFTVEAPVHLVFDLFADHNKFGKLFGGFSRLVKPGNRAVNGVGSVRRIGPWPIGFYEEVSGYQENTMIEYFVSKGGPLKRHQGRVFFEVEEGKTHVKYEMDFESKIPFAGPLIKKALNSSFNKQAKKQMLLIEAMVG